MSTRVAPENIVLPEWLVLAGKVWQVAEEYAEHSRLVVSGHSAGSDQNPIWCVRQ